MYGNAGRFRESNTAFERASGLMTNLGYDETQRAVKLFNDWALILTFAGREIQAEKAYRHAIDAARATPSENTVPAVLLYNYSCVLRELGRFREAKEYADRASVSAREAGDAILLDQIDLQLARIYRDQHDWSRADAVLSSLEPRLRSKLPPLHYAFAALTTEKALLAEARRDLPEALRLGNEAIAIDEASMQNGGPSAAYLPVLLVRRSSVELELGQMQAAAADADRALALFRKAIDDGTLSSHIGRAYLAQGRVLQQQGKRKEAQAAFSLAANHLQETLGPNHPESRIACVSAEALRGSQ